MPIDSEQAIEVARNLPPAAWAPLARHKKAIGNPDAGNPQVRFNGGVMNRGPGVTAPEVYH